MRAVSVSNVVGLAIAAMLSIVKFISAFDAQPAVAGGSVRFRNLAQSAGLSFVYRNSPTPDKYFVESAPGGLAVFDYNDDGRPDIFFTNGAPTPALVKNSPSYSNRLYRNDGGLRFTDDGAAGVEGVGYAMVRRRGLRQRWTCRFVRRRCSSNQLLHNRGDGRFETSPPGPESPAESGPWRRGSTTTTTGGSTCLS
jgi:hypothetical protein